MAEGTPHSISEGELHGDLGLVLDNVQRGQSYIITRDGASIARLVPFEQPNFTTRAEVVQAFATSPVVHAAGLRDDLDAVFEQDQGPA